jgi:serine/threonine protein kinase
MTSTDIVSGDDAFLIDDPVSFGNSTIADSSAKQSPPVFGYAIPLSSRPVSVNSQIGNWSVLQGFVANRDVRIIKPANLEFDGSGCKYIDEGKSFVVKTARLVQDNLGANTEASEDRLIAVKLVKPLDTQEKLENVCLEILALTHPPLRDHRNIVHLIGLTWTTKGDVLLEPALVVEFAEHSALDKYLNSHDLGIHAKVKICVGVAKGLDILHQCSIIHGDVKCENVLMFQGPNDTMVPKLSDFGFSLVLPKAQMNNQVVGTSRWNAPELSTSDPSEFTRDPDRLPLLDIYSYGLLVWRVLKNGLDPFGDVGTEDVVFLKAFTNEPLQRASADVHALMSADELNSPYLCGFERIFKETLPLDSFNRCRSLGWIEENVFSLE